MKVVALAGGTGAAKFLRGLCRVADPAEVTVIGNTGDDLEMWGWRKFRSRYRHVHRRGRR
jgi:LPPG:FO 2-phospho-L-lactate transferase